MTKIKTLASDVVRSLVALKKHLPIFILLGLALLMPTCVRAQQQPLKIYPLTNTTAFSFTNGAIAIPAGTVSNVNSTPFPIWRGRGFSFNAGYWTTNASGSNVCFNFRFASVHNTTGIAGGPLVTNWSGFYPLQINFTNGGAVEVFPWTNLPPATADNVSLGQLVSVTNGATSTLWLDPTNTFVGAYP